jgi:MFS family permease
MPMTFIGAIVTLLLATLLLAKVMKVPRNIWILFLGQPLALSAYPVMVFIGGILSSQIAPDPSLATVPLTVVILATAMSTIPASMLARKFGRRNATMLGLSVLAIGTLLASYSAYTSQFWVFILASSCFGFSMAFIQQLRFAAIESIEDKNDATKVLSILMFAGIFAAFLGPEVVLYARYWLNSPQGYAGSFLGVTILVVVSMTVLFWFKEPPVTVAKIEGNPRSMKSIASQPIFFIAVIAGVIGYGLMSYVMTATPLSMHNNHGHSLMDTKWVIQSHISAMFLPSLFTPWLVNRIGYKHMMMIGTCAYTAVICVALSGQQVMHFWWALVLLGIGWNFLFLTGTVLLGQSHEPNERHKVQATNDFLVFFIQGLFSLLAGWLLFKTSWHVVIYTTVPFVLLMFAASIYYYRLKATD